MPAPVWTPERVKFLKKNHNVMSNKELAAKFKITYGAVTTKKFKLGLSTRKRTVFLSDELAYMKERVGRIPISDISRQLGRNCSVVRRKMEQLGYI